MRIAVVIGAVEGDERCVGRKSSCFLAVFEHHMRQECFSHACLTDNQRMQSVRRIDDGGFGLFDLCLKAVVRPD